MFREDLLEIGYQECDLHYTDGQGLVMEVLGKWFQTLVNPNNLQTSQVELKSVKDIQNPLNYEPIKTRVPNPSKKKNKGKQLLPSSLVKVSDKWYKNKDNGKFLKTEWVELKYIIPK